MRTKKRIKGKSREKFWSQVLKLELPLFIAFFIIILVWRNAVDIFAGDFSNVIANYFTGTGAIVFFTSVLFSSLLCSIVLVSYDREERKKEQESLI